MWFYICFDKEIFQVYVFILLYTLFMTYKLYFISLFTFSFVVTQNNYDSKRMF